MDMDTQEIVLLLDDKPVAVIENMQEILDWGHQAESHGGRDKTHNKVRWSYRVDEASLK